ncbi:toxic anion resistance protein [Nocardioides sp.]|uniref:toxic anion resistance protein n=1 Tax=Nocardioides sp. TaxID=35761 RepID=UPI0035160AC4
MSATESAPGGVVLTPPPAVGDIAAEQAVGSVPLAPERDAALLARARAFADDLAAIDALAPAFAAKVASITTMGARDLQDAARAATQLLDRPVLGGGGASSSVMGALAQVRDALADIDPRRERSGLAGLAGRFGRRRAETPSYADAFRAAESRLGALIRALDAGQDDLRKDNAAIEIEKANLWVAMERLNDYVVLAGHLDRAVTAHADRFDAAGRGHAATVLRTDALHALKQRRQDMLVQLSVCVQGYLALDLVRQNNLELVRGVDAALTATVAAVRTAVVVARAEAQQRALGERIEELTRASAEAIEAAAEGEDADQDAALQRLRIAFADVDATMDAVDRFRRTSLDTVARTVDSLGRRVGAADQR